MKKHLFSFLALCAAFALCLWLVGDAGLATTKETFEDLGFSVKEAPGGNVSLRLFGKRFLVDGRALSTIGEVAREGALLYGALAPEHLSFALGGYVQSLSDTGDALSKLFPENR